ncbi:RNA polymerase sigma-70 factor [Echinicola sp. CAU 1574]|uniref:RNA polymerase sigma-70 factor n=1 Tax=Echinicola arenosa TaxID=2774144 RepID=A0ABR9AG88_9BACT|nr:RNA polymerase sigma-70 factor [Echinicola arenosa]MBD8487762.1 RNA polymerase sigma-70 factor [Echinicola arenosa]
MRVNFDDIEIIEKLRGGIVSAYREIFDRYYSGLCHFAHKYLGDKDDAEDVVQETFMVLWDKREEFQSLPTVKSFLYTVTKNKCINLLSVSSNRKRILEGDYLFSQQFFEENVVEEEMYRALYKSIEKLPEQSQKIVRLNLKGMKNQEIADQLGISLNTVKTLKKSAYKAIRSDMLIWFLAIVMNQVVS